MRAVHLVMRTLIGPTIGALALVLVVTATAATPPPSRHTVRVVIGGRSIARRFPAGPSIAFRYPASWHVTTRRVDNVLDPHTLFVLSTYRVPRRPLDDCDGTHARGRPTDGAFVLVKEVLDGASLRRSLPRLPHRPARFRIPAHGQAGCLPPASVAYQFRVAERAFYVWISVGPQASARTRRALARSIDGLWIARYATP
jgi:hypothetical protein